jgi:hypothetical protein
MDLTSRQRLLAFALTVLVLIGLGIFLFVTGTAHHHTASPPAHHSTAPVAPPTTVPPPSTPTPSGAAATSSPVSIYNWLPFTKQQLAKAAAVVTQFSAYYGTFSYSESASSYVSRMQGLATSQLADQIGSGYAAPGLTDQRKQQKQVSSGSAQIDSLRAFGASSITFVVTITQKITETGGTSHQVNQYAITATETGGTWQASNIQLASVGNQ